MSKNSLSVWSTHGYARITAFMLLLMKVSMLSSFPREEKIFFSWWLQKGDLKIIISLQMLDTAQEQNPGALFLNRLWVPLHYLPMHTWRISLRMLIIFQSAGAMINSQTREDVNNFRAKRTCLKADSCLDYSCLSVHLHYWRNSCDRILLVYINLEKSHYYCSFRL